MKTLAKLSGLLTIIFVMMLGIQSCKKDETGTSYGYMDVKMTDAPGDYLEVNVDIIGMEVHHATAGWIALDINEGIYNLLDLQNNVTVVMADDEKLPVGNITQVRFILGTNNSLVTSAGIRHDLTVPSGSESGLKVNLNLPIRNLQTMEIVLDFDANASVVLEGNGSYKLKPVIKVKSVTYIR